MPMQCHLFGWGKTESGSTSYELRDVTINRLSRQECQGVWGRVINRGHLCFMNSGERASACNGDSGGPARCGNFLVGVTSWGTNGCGPGYPSVYTNLYYFYRWLQSKKF
ncbi:hypothetical protein ACOMHN_035558 [Nucella lapillus]